MNEMLSFRPAIDRLDPSGDLDIATRGSRRHRYCDDDVAGPIRHRANAAPVRYVPRRRLLSGLTFLLVVLLASGLGKTALSQGVQTDLDFDIVRDGSTIGTHSVRFQSMGDDFNVELTAKIEVTILGLTVYERSEKHREEWREGRLVSFTGFTDDDGRTYNVECIVDGTGLKITGSAGTTFSAPGLIPATYWNIGTVESTQLIDAKTGRIVNVTLSEGEPARVQIADREVNVIRYRMTGDEERELWYDEDGKWLGMSFETRDGSVVEFHGK